MDSQFYRPIKRTFAEKQSTYRRLLNNFNKNIALSTPHLEWESNLSSD